MAITAAMVKELREATGAAMMDCKKALVACDGDLDAAAEKMRKDGQAKATKKASRVTAEGTVVFANNGTAGVLLEMNCETDFVSKGDEFASIAQDAANAALAESPADNAALVALSVNGDVIEDRRKTLIAKIGENMTFRRFERVEAGVVGTYSHGGRIGAMVGLDGGDADLAKDIAMHVAAVNPQYVSVDDVPEEVKAKEKEILISQAADSGKPADIIEKMVEGRIRKFLAEITLMGQPFIKDPDQTVEKLLKGAGAKVTSMVRYEVGEGIEVEETDYAAEVAAAAAVAQ